MVGRPMRKPIVALLGMGLLAWPALGQPDAKTDSASGEVRKEKGRPPRIPDAPFVPKRGMVKREKGQFWAGPPDEGRFAQILALTLVPKEKLEERLAEWPHYQELNAEQRQRLVERIDEVRQTARKQALDVAKDFNLRVGPGQEEEFVRMYWRERVQIDQSLRQEFQEKRKQLEQDSEDRILRKFPKAAPGP